jgi:pimeloyl-ACP methyl ester carboxylesterase
MSAMKRALLASVAVPLFALACGSEPQTPLPPSPDAGPPALAWGACPDGYVKECVKLEVPLDHTHPEGEVIDLHLARWPAATQPAKRQVWLLAGGPGQAGWVFGARVPELAARMPDADVYVVDHRGTGSSHRLTCPGQDVPRSLGGFAFDPSKAPSCIAALKKNGDYDRLPHFTSTEAARDVLDAIAKTRASGQKVWLWGVSYGTHWAHRMLQLAPDAIDGVVFDGFITPRAWSVLDYDRGTEEVGEGVAALCDADASCTSHLGPGGALAKVKSLLAALASAPCGPFDREQTRTLLSLLVDSWSLRALVFPAVHRLERCNAGDLDALAFMANAYNALRAKSFTAPYVNSGVLSTNISLGELWARPGQPTPTRDALAGAADAQAFLQGGSLPASLVDLRGATWPIAPDDYGALPVPVVSRAKMLWLSGSLDLHTYPSQSKSVTALYPAASIVEIPWASHTPSRASPLANDATIQCGNEIALAFVEGDGALDTSCLGKLKKPLLEAPDATFAKTYWNTADDWGDGTPKN